MTDQKPNQKELLYNPKNWAFLAFFLSPLLPAIFYYRNCNLLGEKSKGKKVLFGTLLFIIVVTIALTVYLEYSTHIIITEVILAVIIAKMLAKTQIPAYEKMKEEKGLKGGRNESPLILLFIAWIVISILVIPYLATRFFI